MIVTTVPEVPELGEIFVIVGVCGPVGAAAFTVSWKLVVWVTPPPLPNTFIVYAAAGVVGAVVTVIVVEQFGVQLVWENVAVAPAGRPLAENATLCGEPVPTIDACMVFVTEEPCVTARLPLFESEKLNACGIAFTVSWKVVVCDATPALVPVTTMAVVP